MECMLLVPARQKFVNFEMLNLEIEIQLLYKPLKTEL